MRRLVPIYPLILATMATLFVVAPTTTAVVLVEGQQQPSNNTSGTDGGLSASINKSSFNAGDYVLINGTVAKYTDPSIVIIQVYDPKGQLVEYDQSQVYVQGVENSFIFRFQAGLVRQFDPDHWMQLNGEYKVTVTYQPPSLITPEKEFVELYFNYSGAIEAAGAAGGAENTTETGATGGQSGGSTTSVSIVPGSSTLTTDAYQPNPIQVSAGATVTWTNDDSQPHTATSGIAFTPDQRFDSGIMAPAATFEHTFTEAGEFPYFCLLHPNMVGTVSVS